MVHLVNLQEHPDMSPGFEQLQGARCVDVGCGGLNPVGGLFALLLV
jgi:2-polyprenyl-3-methyl-5-hydroxy-6-metoxy-1,4-benzoquinol methylase